MSGSSACSSDSSVSVSYGDCSVPIPVTVHPAEYDLSDIVFEDTEVVYNGQRHTAPVNATVVGKDGIPLLCKVSGGGIDVGEYSVTLSFTTESINYKLPSAVTKTLKINPLSLPVVYSDTEFIYDGSPKIPNATVIGAQGVPIKITLSGAATDAGEYIAYATLSDSNYTLTNTSVKFKILKADFDLSGIYWSEKDFTYDGTPHTVTIMGLPDGITLVGYANASFTDAGSYTAEAAITYDEKNYNTPAGLTHEWKINKADYVFSDFAFFDAEYVFDGLEHYPRVSGNAPVGYDGIALAYSFSRGVTHVAEGRQKVTVIFDSESKNYNTPSPLTAFVEITPKFIEVEWENLSFVYNASQQIPTARSAECKVKVTGSGVDAGDYTAFAISENSDYKISNNKIGFTILKANNLFTTELSATDIYEGDALSAFAKAFSGEVKYSFYKDKELAESVTFPLPVGTYYVIAEVEESKNYHSLKSAPVSFSVLEILPVELCVEFLEELVAMKRLSEHSVSVYLLNNNGSTTPLSKDELSVEYENGELLKAGDRMLKISAYGFSRELAISVKKSVVDLPTLAPITYNGKVIFPSELLSPLFIHDFSGAKDAGEYAVHFALTDSDNYEFRGGISTLTLLINKAPITLEVNKNGSSYKLLYGIIFDGDELYEEYYESDGKVFLRINNPNYELTVIPREEKNGAFYVLLMFLLGIVILLATLGLYIVFWKKERYGTSTNPINSNEPHNSKPFSDSSLKQNNSTVTKFNATEKLSNPIMSPKKTSKPISKDLSNAKSENEKAENGKKEFPLDPPLETLLAVDESYANNLISDQVAKSLIAEDVTVVETDGKRRCILNLDTISESFSAGETVSINDFKRKGLIPSDARYVKILARGVIDKPITILANSFSLPAVKMIALTGGSAKRVRTVKRKL